MRASRCPSPQDGSAFARPLQPQARGLRIGWLGRPGRPPALRARHPAAVRKRAAALRGAGRGGRAAGAGLPLRRGLADLADLAALPGGRHAGALRRRPEETRAAQARGAVGIRPRPGPERPAGVCRQPEPHALLPPHGEPVRALRPAGAAQRAGLALPGRMDLAARGGRPHDGHLPPLDGGGDLRHAGRPAGDERAGGLQRRRPADGHAADRPAAGRPGRAECRGRLRAEHRRAAGAAAGASLERAAHAARRAARCCR